MIDSSRILADVRIDFGITRGVQADWRDDIVLPSWCRGKAQRALDGFAHDEQINFRAEKIWIDEWVCNGIVAVKCDRAALEVE